MGSRSRRSGKRWARSRNRDPWWWAYGPTTWCSRTSSAARVPVKLRAEVDVVEALGTESFVHCTVAGSPFVARLPGAARPARGEKLGLAVAPEDVHVFDAAHGRALWARAE